MIKAIIFDCFGVLTTEGWLLFKDKYFGDDEALASQAIDLNRQTNLGLISHEEFIQAVADLANIPATEATHIIDNNVPNEPLLEYIAALKPKYKLGVLSNASTDWMNKLFQPEQVALFDKIILSYEAGAVKPDPRAYEIAAERLGVSLDQCVFIDDQERHCIGARESGMKTVLYKDFKQARQELEQLLADTKS